MTREQIFLDIINKKIIDVSSYPDGSMALYLDNEMVLLIESRDGQELVINYASTNLTPEEMKKRIRDLLK